MTISNNVQIPIKGIREGLLATLGEGDWSDLRDVLLRQVRENSAFFHGARLALEVGSRPLHAVELGALRDALSDQGVSLWAVIGSSPITEITTQVLGMATRLSVPAPERVIRSLDTNLSGESAVLVQRTLRSGFRLEHTGHVVVIGDVNPGAEISAGGSVVVWGRLRGTAHAGVSGDQNAVISALELSPVQIRIADIDGSIPRRRGKTMPETALIRNGTIILESWNPKTK